jgi:hypothetical protein
MIQLDDDVVDAETDERGQKVLDGLDAAGVAREAGRVIDSRYVLNGCGYLEPSEVAAAEPYTGVSRRGPEGESDFVAGVKTYSSARNCSS